MAEHKDLQDPNIHEPKGTSSASAGQAYIADGLGSGVWTTPESATAGSTEQGIYDYNDLLTATTPISLVLADTDYELTNDGEGPFTNKTYALSGLPELWNVSTNRFEFNGGEKLALGDTVDIRFDLEITTTGANTAVTLSLELGTEGTPYIISLMPEQNFKASGTYKLLQWMGVYMGDTNTLMNEGRVLMSADSTGVTVKVNGWYIRPLHTLV